MSCSKLLQGAADSFVETYCGRIFTGGDFTEDHPGGSRALFLKNFRSTPSTRQRRRQPHLHRRDDPGSEPLHDPRRTRRDRSARRPVHRPTAPSANAFPNAVRVSYTHADRRGAARGQAGLRRTHRPLVPPGEDPGRDGAAESDSKTDGTR